MKRLRGALFGVDQGNVELFSDFTTGGEMWTGHGARERCKWVAFSENYRDAPVVHLSLSLWDMVNNANIRADLVAETVRVDGFGLVFRTWADTRVARVRIAWMSIGEIRSEDDRDLS